MVKRDGRVRGWRWRRNPLKRRSDIAEACVGAATAVLLLATPAVGVATALVTERSALDQSTGLHRVTAHLTEDAPAASPRYFGRPDDSQVRAAVRWTTPGGSAGTGTASVAAGSKAGSATTVWLDGTGGIRPTPPTTAQARAQGAVLGTDAALGAGVVAAGLRWGAAACLGRRRAAQWDRAWADLDTHSGHHHA